KKSRRRPRTAWPSSSGRRGAAGDRLLRGRGRLDRGRLRGDRPREERERERLRGALLENVARLGLRLVGLADAGLEPCEDEPRVGVEDVPAQAGLEPRQPRAERRG